jgi:probable HAF family extracellular repeat protein
LRGFYGFTCVSHGFLDSGGSFTTLDDPSAGSGVFIFGGTYATGINASGQIVGYYNDSSGASHAFLYSGGSNVAHGFLDSGGTYTTIDDPSAAKSKNLIH